LVHEALETLEVTFIKGAATSSLLDAVSLPSLKNLGLHYLGTENVPLLPVISLVSRSSASCSLHKLSLTRTVFAEEDLVRCLEVLPSLVELCLCVRELVHPIFGVGYNLGAREGLLERFVCELFRCQDICQLILPQLHKFMYEGFVTCPIPVLLSMLQWRWRKLGSVRLKHVTIYTGRTWTMTEEEETSLDELRGEGMQICLSP
jgi:hypothetical protein